MFDLHEKRIGAYVLISVRLSRVKTFEILLGCYNFISFKFWQEFQYWLFLLWHFSMIFQTLHKGNIKYYLFLTVLVTSIRIQLQGCNDVWNWSWSDCISDQVLILPSSNLVWLSHGYIYRILLCGCGRYLRDDTF